MSQGGYDHVHSMKIVWRKRQPCMLDISIKYLLHIKTALQVSTVGK